MKKGILEVMEMTEGKETNVMIDMEDIACIQEMVGRGKDVTLITLKSGKCVWSITEYEAIRGDCYAYLMCAKNSGM